MKKYYTSEQVGIGHPDKVADQLSDAVLTHVLKNNHNARVAVETMVKGTTIVFAGEVSGYQLGTGVLVTIVDTVYKRLGLKYEKVINLISAQSDDIWMGVENGGAGDQGIMFGYACNETKQMLPLAYVIATDALKMLNKVISDMSYPLYGYAKNLKLDSKAQVTIVEENGIKGIDKFLISVQHNEDINQDEVRSVVEDVMLRTAANYNMELNFEMLVNPTGQFIEGGPTADAGLTGRKIIADTYGGYALHGGGAFSGKDPSKVDRSAAYMARHLAKWALNRYGLEECTVQLAYAIGVAEPMSINVKSNLPEVQNEGFAKAMKAKFDLTPNGMIEALRLKEIDYGKMCVYGHFTDQTMPWEKLNGVI